MKIRYEDPNGIIIDNPNVNDLRTNMIDKFPNYWHQGSGAAMIKILDDNQPERLLLIFPSDEYGIYLKYVFKENGRVKSEWLSMENSARLDTYVECSDEWYASEGLFLPLEKAWAAICDFLMFGEKSYKVDWRNVEDMPEKSNW